MKILVLEHLRVWQERIAWRHSSDWLKLERGFWMANLWAGIQQLLNFGCSQGFPIPEQLHSQYLLRAPAKIINQAVKSVEKIHGCWKSALKFVPVEQ